MAHNKDIRDVEILLVEDSPTDAMLTREAFRLSKFHNPLHWVKDGVEALAFLRREEPYTAAPRPDIILLDLNMPRKDGREVLREIKQDTSLSAIPVVVLTTSAQDFDILKVYELHGNCYMTKPVDFEKFASVIRQFGDYWFNLVSLPPS